MTQTRRKRRYSVQLVFLTIFFVFILLSTAVMNTYPTISSRDTVFSSKQSMMLNQVSVMSSSLSALEVMNSENVGQVMELVDVNEFGRVVVVGQDGKTLYDTLFGDAPQELTEAMQGIVNFRCRYDGSAFMSSAVSPVVSYGNTIGAVYIFEYDSEQAGLIKDIQSRMRNISILLGAAELLLIILSTGALTKRIRELVKAMQIVREGDYDYRLTPKGNDEMTELASEFNDMTQKLHSTEELRRRFVSDASHELRTPLASIRLLSDSILQSDNMDEETMREFVTDIGSEAERLQRITEKLMKLTKMDGKMSGEKKAIDMKRLTDKTVHLLTPLAQSSNVTIYTELEEGCTVLAAEDDIYQVIFNLAENAIKYNTFGGNVFIYLRKAEGNVRLTVEDTGIGIPEEDVPHIFGRFYRVDKARSSGKGGSGLGLSIVHDAVMINGGSIKVEARETVGTRFVVTFPEYVES